MSSYYYIPIMSLKDYKKEKLENHIYNTPDTYVGGCDLITEVLPVFCNKTKKIIYKEVEYIPALINIFNEIRKNESP